jgi:hypothetical protein
MKFTTQLNINNPIQSVWKHLNSPEIMYKMYPGLKSIKIIDGEPDQIGSIYEYKFGLLAGYSRIIETIDDFREPEFVVTTLNYRRTKVINKYSLRSEGESTIVEIEVDSSTRSIFRFLPFIGLINTLLYKSLFNRMKVLLNMSDRILEYTMLIGWFLGSEITIEDFSEAYFAKVKNEKDFLDVTLLKVVQMLYRDLEFYVPQQNFDQTNFNHLNEIDIHSSAANVLAKLKRIENSPSSFAVFRGRNTLISLIIIFLVSLLLGYLMAQA